MNFHRKAKEVLYVTMRNRHELPVSTLWICTDEIDGDNRAGRVYCRLFPDGICFRDLGELLVIADIMFDRAGYPQAYQENRSFVSDNIRGAVYIPELYFTNEELQEKQGKILTEYIIVKSRRRSGWQDITQANAIPAESVYTDTISDESGIHYMTETQLAAVKVKSGETELVRGENEAHLNADYVLTPTQGSNQKYNGYQISECGQCSGIYYLSDYCRF